MMRMIIDEDEVDVVEEYDLRVEAEVGDVGSQPKSSSSFQCVLFNFLLVIVSVCANLI